MKKFTTDEFITKAILVHNNKYDYSRTTYELSRKKVSIICPSHGTFEQKPNDHLSGYGCPRCGKTGRYNQETFIEAAAKKHNNRFSYLKTIYRTSKEKICITCLTHGDFLQKAADHLYGYGCSKCAVEDCHNHQRSNTEDFINKATKLSNNRFTYEKVNYIDSQTKVIISCNIHGDFEQSPNVHLSGVGCPRCNASKGELKIEKWLTLNNILYERQMRIKGCRDKNSLPFDFGIFDKSKNLLGLIEFQGRQHFIALPFWGGINTLNNIQKRDRIKKEYCQQNKITLLIIHHNCYNDIENILKKFMEKL
jgi:Zn finger protein HypA/HybF involved in hydrogenase expression